MKRKKEIEPELLAANSGVATCRGMKFCRDEIWLADLKRCAELPKARDDCGDLCNYVIKRLKTLIFVINAHHEGRIEKKCLESLDTPN